VIEHLLCNPSRLSYSLTPHYISTNLSFNTTNSAVSGPKTTILIGNEERDKVLQAHFVQALGEQFTVKPIKRKKLCGLEGYHHLVQLWACKKKRCKSEGCGSQQQQQRQQQQEVPADEREKREDGKGADEEGKEGNGGIGT
jgi:hypothetical protein